MPTSLSISTHSRKSPIEVRLLTLFALEQHADAAASWLGARSITLAIRQRVALAAGVQEAALAVVVEALAAGLAGCVGGWKVAHDELGDVEGRDARVERRGGREDGEHAKEEELEESVEHHGGDIVVSWGLFVGKNVCKLEVGIIWERRVGSMEVRNIWASDSAAAGGERDSRSVSR
jgi:hypothetical protein